MKLGLKPEHALEWLALKLNVVPEPIAQTHIAFVAARAIMAGTSLGIFEAIEDGANTAEAIARLCGTDPRATRSLVDCLVGLEYVRVTRGRYRNSQRARKWLLKRSPTSVRDKLIFQEIEWNIVGRLEEYVRSGVGLDVHATLDERSWGVYQDAMRSLASGAAPAIARRLRLPKEARRMLDIGGSHGLHSAAICRRHPQLEAEILDLPAALAHRRPPDDGLAGRIRFREGDALREDLGVAKYDLVLISNLVHHFSEAENEALAKRVSRSLRPGGMYVVADFEKPSPGGRNAPIGGALDLYFSLTSSSGTWPVATIRAWQKGAGLRPRREVRLPDLPGFVLSSAVKP